MGTIRMETDTKVLKEVVIDENIVRHEPGMDIVNMVQMRKGKTDLVDLLRDVSGLIVTDNSITIPGKGSVKIMFNGRQKRIPNSQLTEILKSYTAANVTKVEIIREPDVKFDAEGNYGVLNIITERLAEYVGGSIGNTTQYNTRWLNIRFFLDKSHNLSTSVTGSYGGKFYTSAGITEERYNVSINASYSCLKNKLSLSLALRNLIAGNYRGTSYSNSGMTFRFNNDFSYRCIVLGASYSFGKEIRTKKKTHSNSDIKNRF